MLHRTQFSIASVFLAMLAVAIYLQFGQLMPAALLFWLTVFVILGSEFLIRNLPSGIEKLYRCNCTRADGSWSTNRESIEIERFRVFRSNIRLMLFITLLPFAIVAALLWFGNFPSFHALAVCLLWLFASIAILRNGYHYFLQQHIFRMKIRAQNFKIRDLHLHLKNFEPHRLADYPAAEEAPTAAGNS